jgi:hypothetical protein
MPRLRELNGRIAAGELRECTGIGAVMTMDGKNIASNDLVELGNWPRPILRGGQAVLLVEEDQDGWRCLAKEIIKGLSE